MQEYTVGSIAVEHTNGHANGHGSENPASNYLTEHYDWRPRLSDESKTHLFSMRLDELSDRLGTLIVGRVPWLYPTKSDLGRDAFYYLCRFVYEKYCEKDEEIESLIRQIDAAGNAHYTATLRERVRTHTDDLTDSLTDALADNALEECHRQIEQFWRAVRDIHNDWVRHKFIDASMGSPTVRAVVKTLVRYGYAVDTDCVLQYT